MFSTFFLFSFIPFLFDNFSFHLCVHPFVLFPPCSLLSFSTLSLFLHHSVSLSLFSSTPCFLICFSPSPCFLRISFFVVKHSSFHPFDLDLFVFLLLYPFFFISVSAFFFLLLKKSSKFSVVIFLQTKSVFFFEPSRFLNFSRMFSSLRRHFSLFVQCFLFFSRFFNITYLDFLLPIFFLGLFKKSFCFRKKSKNH